MIRKSAGLSYVEVLIAMVLVSIALVPMLEGLNISLSSNAHYQSSQENQNHLTAIMEEVLSTPFSDLLEESLTVNDPIAPTAYSDPSGAPNRRLVYLHSYDIDNADLDNDIYTGTDAGILWIRVELEASGQTIETLMVNE